MESGGGRYLTRRDLEAVIRRAAELETSGGSTVPELSEADVVRIAQEVGLSEANIRRALAEHSSSAEMLLADRGVISRLCGSGLVTASRTVSRSAEEVTAELENYFQSHQSLQLVRRTQHTSLWEPDKSVVASVVRGLDVFGRGYKLAKRGRAVELRVVPLSEESCRITLTSDLGNERAGWFWGFGVAVGMPLTWVWLMFILEGGFIPDPWLLATPGIIASTVALARVGYRRGVERMRLVLDGLLDRLEHDEPLEPPRPSWRDLLK
ncbi:MAG: hypothetical protein JSW46_20465 [Gemmatimonadota bacterium]|nr:MAG: hypothetical protein JSW46_20465 [Gemmatimonadota bacterium]